MKIETRKKMLDLYRWAQRIIAPGLVFSQQVYEQVLTEHVTPETVWLDLGCGHQVLPAWREAAEKRLVAGCRRIVGIDYDMPSLERHRNIAFKAKADISRLPFKDECFDLVTANMVVEHLDHPAAQFREVHRVLKPGGLFIFHTPNALGYFSLARRMVPGFINNRLVHLLDGREAGDVFRVHYKANTGRRIDELAREVSFDVVKRKMIVTDAVFSVIPPLMIFELMWIRALMTGPLAPLRTNIIAILRKPRAEEAAGAPAASGKGGQNVERAA